MTWPPGQSLDDAFDKLRWAKKHFEALRIQIEAIEKRDTHRISFKVDPKAGEYKFYVHHLEDVSDPDWPLMIGDCIHNARTALDYLMVRLVAVTTGMKPRAIGGVQFPIYDDPNRFSGAVSEVRKKPLFHGYLARIEELQPFNLNNPSIWGLKPLDFSPRIGAEPVNHALPVALSQLSALDNIDKHRVIHATWLGGKTDRLNPLGGHPTFVPEDFEQTGSLRMLGALENDAEIGALNFATPLPHDWEPSQVDMKRNFPLEISILDESNFAYGVVEVLRLCLWGVEAVLRLFEPVFTAGTPPLPVTAVPNPIPDPDASDRPAYSLPGTA
jgi:hypothetical protein